MRRYRHLGTFAYGECRLLAWQGIMGLLGSAAMGLLLLVQASPVLGRNVVM